MKKVKIIITIMLLLIIATSIKVYAAQSYKLEIGGGSSVKKGEEITLTLSLKDLTELGGTAGGITALTANVEYDDTKLEKVSQQGLNGFSVTWGNKIVIDNAEGVNQNTDVATIKFKVKENATIGNTTITVSNIVSSNGSSNITSSNSTKTITIAESGTTPNQSNNNNGGNNNGNNNNNIISNPGSVGTETLGKLPQTGMSNYIVYPTLGMTILFGIFSFIKYRAYKIF